jgi:glycosyltransferase involved in cell wall biosynthesis
MPRLGVGLPVYNGERHLREAAESVLAQTYGDFELVIVDNASTDGTEEIGRALAAADRRVRYHRNAQNIGAGPNFNLAFRITDGEYFKWTAHDDVLHPEFLAACVEALDADPSVVLAFTEADMIDEESRFACGYDPELPRVGSPRPSERFRDLVLSEHWCLDVFGVIRRAVLERTPLIASYIGSDRNLLAELGLWGRYHRVPRVLFHSRDHRHRSVRAIDIRARGAWFDPTLAGRIALPFWRCLAEYALAIRRVPLPETERLACCAALARWLPPNRWRLKSDLEAAAKQLTARVASRVARTPDRADGPPP